MMAVRSPMMASPNHFISAFSPYSDVPSSPGHQSAVSKKSSSPGNPQNAENAKHLSAPAATSAPPVQPVHDIIDPSPIAPSSNGTEFTDMEDEGEKKEEQSRPLMKPALTSWSPSSGSQLGLKIRTDTSRMQPPRPRLVYDDYEEEPQSVIHAPPGFKDFHTGDPHIQARPASIAAPEAAPAPTTRVTTPTPAPPPAPTPPSEDMDRPNTSSPSQRSDVTIRSPTHSNDKIDSKHISSSPMSPPPLTIPTGKEKDWKERSTPQAQTRQEAEAIQRHTRTASLEDIPESHDRSSTGSKYDSELGPLGNPLGEPSDADDEISTLKSALSECWIFCNTLANLSSIHRERLFSISGKGDMQEQAWRSCWNLCKKLYESRDDDSTSQVRPTLDLCREFCQSLFEVRVRENEVADSVLRVSFELNNHLYNTHDRHLPEAFRERTLDFYITLCHRLMKQKTRLAQETDSLLRACWSLAEMLFSLRQNKREGKKPDEELLGSAVQACWELCDLFREGWTQIRPDRGTPRPSQTTFTQVFQQVKRASPSRPTIEEISGVPETPTTIFEDTATGSPDEAPGPNILVFGQGETSTGTNTPSPGSRQRSPPSPPKATKPATVGGPPGGYANAKWSSGSSTLSASSHSNASTNSTVTSLSKNSNNTAGASPADEDPNLILLKLLFIKAAQTTGFERSSSVNLPTFVKSLPGNAFGSQTWQITLLEHYRKVVTGDPTFKDVIGRSTRAFAVDVARAVNAMVSSGYFGWLRDLYKLVFGFGIEEVGAKKNVAIQI